MKVQLFAPWYWFWGPFDDTKPGHHCHVHGFDARKQRWFMVSALSDALAILVWLFADLLGVHWMMALGWIIGIAGVAPTLLFAWYGVLDMSVCFPSCSCNDSSVHATGPVSTGTDGGGRA